MAQPIKLTANGAGIASAKVPNDAMQIVGLLAVADTVALACTLYCCPTKPSGSIPAGSTEIGTYPVAASSFDSASYSPDGIDCTGYLAADFTDTGGAHALYLYLK